MSIGPHPFILLLWRWVHLSWTSLEVLFLVETVRPKNGMPSFILNEECLLSLYAFFFGRLTIDIAKASSLLKIGHFRTLDLRLCPQYKLM